MMNRVVQDTFGRPLRNLRISVTDRCNLRCRYCMPEDEYVWLPKASLLSFEELERLVHVFAGLGVDKIRLTGGEPLLRRGMADLIGRITAHPDIRDVAMTTNGVLLCRVLPALKQAGLHRLTVSLDTLHHDRFEAFAKSARLHDVLRGLQVANDVGFVGTKINSVITRGVNEDELVSLLGFAESVGAELRFIEYMDVGGATQWSLQKVVSRAEILEKVEAELGTVEPMPRADSPSAPAERFRLPSGQTFGVIASTTAPFCRDCDRARITADGVFYLCLYADQGIDLRAVLRSGSSDEVVADTIVRAWARRDDRGAERRRETPERGVLYQIEGLRSDPHREMHTRGG